MEKTWSVDDGAALGPMCFISDDPLLFFFLPKDDPLLSRLLKARLMVYYILMVVVLMPLVPLLFLPSVYYEPTYSVDLSAFEGLHNASHGGNKLLSPAFNLTVHVDNLQAFRAWCHNHGEAWPMHGGVSGACACSGGLRPTWPW